MPVNRNRTLYFFLIVSTIAVGLASRTSIIPDWIYPYLGDALYTLMYFFIIGFLFPGMKPIHVAIISIGFCYLIEISQLYQAEWIVEIRNTRLGGLILGFGFLWSDLVSYFVGGMLGYGMEYLMLKKRF